MLEVLTAIQVAFNANAYLTATFANGLEVSLGQDNENIPTCILAIIGSPTTYQTAISRNASTGTPIRTYVEDLQVQFTVYSIDPNVCAAALDAIVQTFDHVPMALATEKWLDSRRMPGLGTITREDVRSARSDIQFSFKSERQLGS